MLLVHTTLPPGPRMHPPTTHPARPRHPNDPHPTTPNPDEKGSVSRVEESRFDVLRVAELRRCYGIARLEVFGSVARGERRPNSDVDLLYTLERGARSIP